MAAPAKPSPKHPPVHGHGKHLHPKVSHKQAALIGLAVVGAILLGLYFRHRSGSSSSSAASPAGDSGAGTGGASGSGDSGSSLDLSPYEDLANALNGLTGVLGGGIMTFSDGQSTGTTISPTGADNPANPTTDPQVTSIRANTTPVASTPAVSIANDFTGGGSQLPAQTAPPIPEQAPTLPYTTPGDWQPAGTVTSEPVQAIEVGQSIADGASGDWQGYGAVPANESSAVQQAAAAQSQYDQGAREPTAEELAPALYDQPHPAVTNTINQEEINTAVKKGSGGKKVAGSGSSTHVLGGGL